MEVLICVLGFAGGVALVVTFAPLIWPDAEDSDPPELPTLPWLGSEEDD